MITRIGICDIIDWNKVINDCKSHQPAYIGPSHSRSDNLPGLEEILNKWDQAGYKLEKDNGTVAWDMFLPGKQFDESIITKFSDFFEIEVTNAWISRIKPGRFSPMHWDVHDDEEKLDERPKYHCHIGKPEWGHIFIAGEQCLYNQPQGTTYRWDSRRLWHAGTNCGLTDKYLLNTW
jgi:hypothetical protein